MGYNEELEAASILAAQKERIQQQAKPVKLAAHKIQVAKHTVLYDKKYDKVIEIVGKLNEVLKDYGLEADCVSGTYDPIDIQVHIGEVDKPTDI